MDNSVAERIKNDIQRDYFMSAEEAKEFGLVDQVVENRPTVPTGETPRP